MLVHHLCLLQRIVVEGKLRGLRLLPQELHLIEADMMTILDIVLGSRPLHPLSLTKHIRLRALVQNFKN